LKTKQLKVGDKTRITYHPKDQPAKRVQVTIVCTIEGKDLVALDRNGDLYTTWWETDSVRPLGKRRIFQRHWKKYENGIYSLKRSLTYALLGTKKIKVPTMEELQAFCKCKNAEIALLEEDPSKCLERIAGQFDEIEAFLSRRKRWTLTEAQRQLDFFLLLRDSQGRLNIGVLRARLATIDRRFEEELKHLLGWMPHYAARLSAVSNLQHRIEAKVAQTQRQLNAMLSHQAFTSGSTTAKQITGLRSNIQTVAQAITRLQKIKPFTTWAGHCLADLRQAYRQVGFRQFNDARTAIETTLQSIRLQIVGFELEDLICDLSLDIMFNQVNRNAYISRLEAILHQVTGIQDSHFRQPVCRQIAQLINRAIQGLQEIFVDQKIKDYLKQAVKLI